jgi:hypothetical protein
MKRIAVLLAGLVTAALMSSVAPAQAVEPLTRPTRDDPSIITTAGTYTQEQADANRATYLAMQDYHDQQVSWYQSHLAGDLEVIGLLQETLHQRDVEHVAAVNARWEEMVRLSEQRDDARAVVARKTAKIAELRAIIRDLREDQ